MLRDLFLLGHRLKVAQREFLCHFVETANKEPVVGEVLFQKIIKLFQVCHGAVQPKIG